MYQLTVTAGNGKTTRTYKTYRALSRAIDRAWKTPGFTGYRVSPAVAE